MIAEPITVSFAFDQIKVFLTDDEKTLILNSKSYDVEKTSNKRKKQKIYAEQEFQCEILKELLKNHLTNATVICVLEKIICRLTNVAETNVISLIFNHPEFDALAFLDKKIVATEKQEEQKLSVFKFIKTLATFHTDQMIESHVPMILGAYSGTLSATDAVCIQLLQMYETKFDLYKFSPIVWGSTGLDKYANLKLLGPTLWNRPEPKDVLSLIDTARMFKTSRFVPLELSLDVFIDAATNETFKALYDPRFFLPLLNSLLGADSLLSCKTFVQKNCVALALACLSCRDDGLRRLAYVVLDRFLQHCQNSGEKFDGKAQLLSTLNVLRNSIETPDQRLPSIISQFFCRAVYLTLNPYDLMFPLISSFLLLKPTLDFGQVPEFYKLFHSSTLDRLHERHWILQLILDGFRDHDDYRIFEKRYVVQLFLSFWSCCLCDPKSRDFIGKILKKACTLKESALDLCLKHNFCGWISINLHTAFRDSEFSQIASLMELLAVLGQTLLKEEKRFQQFKVSWLACFALFLRYKIDEKSKFALNANVHSVLFSCANLIIPDLGESCQAMDVLKNLTEKCLALC